MNPIVRIIRRYKSLPRLPLVDKLSFALWKGLGKRLMSKKIVDASGILLASRKEKPQRGKPAKSFEKLICVNGFTSSGSSAVIDLLSEYRNVTTCLSGTLSEDIVARSKKRFEYDLVRGAGGLYSLEHAFATQNIYERDASIRIYMALAEYFYINATDFFDNRFLNVTREFVRSLIDNETITPTGFDYCKHLTGLGTHSANFILGHDPKDEWEYLYYLKNITVEEYRKLARQYIYDMLKNVESEEYLVLDQGSADYNCDLKKAKDYFGEDSKHIFVWRDPRDVFTRRFNIRYTEGCIPHKVDDFIRWYRNFLPNFQNIKSDNMLLLRFEDLITKYDETKSQIEKFLNLDPKDHTHPLTLLKPAESQAYSIGIWKKYPYQDEIMKVKKELKEYCFE